jgi:HEPN domain-containing protein
MIACEVELLDIQQQIEYWRSSSGEDFSAAVSLAAQHPRHALFFAHLALEKALKAQVTRVTTDVSPRIHDLLRLAEPGAVVLSAERRAFLARFQQFRLAGRYPDLQRGRLDAAGVAAELAQAREVLTWLLTQLP